MRVPLHNHATSGVARAWRTLLVGASIVLPLERAGAIPPWARKYNMDCTGCHYPVVPRLNATGLNFKWAGYRMPSEIGDKMDVKKIEEYLGAQGIVQYGYAKTQRQAADVNGTSVPSASLFAGGPVGKNFGSFIQFERTADAAIDLVAQVAGTWGSESRFGSVRVGTGHALVGGAVAGFDRPVGVLTPLPLATSVTAASPFEYAGDAVGIDASLVLAGTNRTSIQLLNGRLPEGAPEEATSTRRDVAITNQFIWGRHGDGLTATAYFGSIAGLDSSAASVVSRYYRLAASANRWISTVELLGGVVYGRDSRLPVGPTSSFAAPRVNGVGYWGSVLYAVPKTLTSVYGRYESVDQNRDEADDALRRFVLGGVIPVNVPQYLRLTLEYFRDVPQLSTAPRRQGATAQVQLAF